MGVLLLLVVFAPVQDPARVDATLSSSTVRVGETVVLEVRVESDGSAPESIELPPLPRALEVIGTRNYSQIQFSFPGGRSRIVRREVVLRAVAPGRTRIPPIGVDVDGGHYRTPPLSLNILSTAGPGPAPTPGGAGPQRGYAQPQRGYRGGPGPTGGARSRAPDGEVVLRTSLSPDTVYVGEQVTLRSEALFSEEVRLWLRRAPEYEPPQTSGFWVYELPDRMALDSRVVDGRAYQVQTFRRAYFPFTAGRYLLPPARLQYDVRRGFLAAPESHQLASDSLPLVVLPPPRTGRPPNFTGAVGRFQAHARIEPAVITAGAAVVLTVEIEGEGNIKALPPPALPALPAVRTYPPNEESEVDIQNGRVRGTKRFTWVLIPNRPGRIELPPIEYPYFDPARDAYAVARTAPLTLQVQGQPGRVAGTEEDDVQVQLRLLKNRPAAAPLDWVRSRGFATAQLIPLLALLGILVTQRRAARSGPPSRRALRRRRRRVLGSLRPLASGTDPSFFGRLAEALRDWLAERLAIPALRTTAPEAMSRVLEDQGVAPYTAQALVELIGRIERAPYAPDPPGPAERRGWLDDAERLAGTVDGQARRRSKVRPGAATLLLLAGALGTASTADARGENLHVAARHGEASAVTRTRDAETWRAAAHVAVAADGRSEVAPARNASQPRGIRFSSHLVRSHAAQTAPTMRLGMITRTASSVRSRGTAQAAPTGDQESAGTTFEAGIAAYRAGDYTEAARAFTEYVTARPRDAHGWYDLGNAYHRAGMTGRATWAWLRAARLDPRDGDIRHNLDVAAADPDLLRRAIPAIPLSTNELLLLAGIAWLGGAIALGAWTLHHRRRVGLAGAAAVLIALALVSGWAVPRFQPATGVVFEPRTPLLAAPTLRAEEIARLEAGSGVRVLETDEGWLRVATPDGTQGWIESEGVGLL